MDEIKELKWELIIKEKKIYQLRDEVGRLKEELNRLRGTVK